MHKFEIGEPIEVLDSGLAMLRAIMAEIGENIINHHGWVHSIEPDGTIMVLFPIGDADPLEHSQLAPYEPRYVLPREGEHLIIQDT